MTRLENPLIEREVRHEKKLIFLGPLRANFAASV